MTKINLDLHYPHIGYKMIEVKFYDEVDDAFLQFAVVISKTDGKWVFCRHRERDTYEIPGGHRESGEDITATARRELQEETGAVDFTIKPVCVYSMKMRMMKVSVCSLSPRYFLLNRCTVR